MFSTTYAAGVPWNESKCSNERFNTLLQEARIERDEGKRAQIYYEMQELVRDDGGSVIPMFANILEAAADKVQFENYCTNIEADGLKMAERMWFKV